jgi:Sulfotransferase domain
MAENTFLDISSSQIMADSPPNSNSTFTSSPLKEEEEEQKQLAVKESTLRPRRPFKEILKIEELHAKYRDLIFKLPVEHRWSIRQYQGFWLWEKLLPGFLRTQEVFEPHPNDIVLASFPKSGTTWLKSLLFTIVHRNKYAFSNHPLLKLNSHDCVPQLETTYMPY